MNKRRKLPKDFEREVVTLRNVLAGVLGYLEPEPTVGITALAQTLCAALDALDAPAWSRAYAVELIRAILEDEPPQLHG